MNKPLAVETEYIFSIGTLLGNIEGGGGLLYWGLGSTGELSVDV